jgi:hypothetical protein
VRLTCNLLVPPPAGRYDWSGELELAPDPFQEWRDAESLLATNASASTAPSGHRRTLLQSTPTSTGVVPVQGRVAIKESRAPVDPSGSSTPGVVSLDDTGDITLICQGGTCPTTAPGPVGQAGGSQGQGEVPEAPAVAGKGQAGGAVGAMSLVNVLLIALVVPAGLALCATGVAAAVLHRRRKQQKKQHQPAKALTQKNIKRPGCAHRHRVGEEDLQLEGKQGAKESWRSVNGMSWVPGAGPAAVPRLRRSTNGASCNGTAEYTDADLALQHHGQGTNVERLQPGETGFGSMPGGVNRLLGMAAPARTGSIDWSAAMLPPTRDSFDLQRGGSIEWSGATRPHGAKWSMAGSLAGMASTMASMFNSRWASCTRPETMLVQHLYLPQLSDKAVLQLAACLNKRGHYWLCRVSNRLHCFLRCCQCTGPLKLGTPTKCQSPASTSKAAAALSPTPCSIRLPISDSPRLAATPLRRIQQRQQRQQRQCEARRSSQPRWQQRQRHRLQQHRRGF